MARSAKFAWAIAGIAILLLLVVFFSGIGTSTATWAGAGGLVLVAVLACPLMMGAMMWMMMHKGNRH